MKRSTVILFCMLATKLALAQEDSLSRSLLKTERDRFRFGLKLSMGLHSLQGKDVSTLSTGGPSSARKGFSAGVMMDTRLNPHLYIRSEIAVQQSSALLNIYDSASNTRYDSKFRSLYLMVHPFMPAYRAGGFQVYAGPYFGLLINASIQRKTAGGGLETDKSIFGNALSPGGHSQKLDAGIAAGLEYEWKNGLTIGVNYRRGLIGILEDPRIQTRKKIYNQDISVSIGYKF